MAGKIILIILGIFFFAVQPALAADIVLDGSFNDWADQPFVGDPSGDAINPPTDLAAFYFATNPNQEIAYFMAERWQTSGTDLTLQLRIDANNNGDYSEAVDRLLVITYDIKKPRSKIAVVLYDGRGNWLQQTANNQDWGENDPGARVEWGISFAALGIVPNQTVRMQCSSLLGNTIADTVPEVQWSPANATGWPLLSLLTVAGVVALIVRQKKLK
jgi:hypothetical protein